MRRGVLLLLTLAPALAVGIVTACAPIFGIESRYQGATWCEQDAQFTPNGYCDDFDRVPTATTMQELVADYNGSPAITDAAASSPPNSLGLTSVAVSGEAGVVAGHLVSFGPMLSSGLPAFKCQADLRPSEIAAIGEAGVTTTVMAVGGQVAGAGPEVVALSITPSGDALFSLQRLASPMTPPEQVSDATCASIAAPELTGDWVTFELLFRPVSRFDGGASPCPLTEKPSKTGKGSGAGGYEVLGRVGPFDLQAVRFSDPGFIGQPYFVYGMILVAPAPALSLHIDNVRCTLMPDGGE
jgi:hypothetical protein